MSTTVEKIKEKLSAVEVISSYIKLEKAGSNLKARCPFHNEKTPSFFVSPSRGTYYCFGCGAKGDIFTFVQEFEGADFMGALKILAGKAGVPIEFENLKERGEKERLYKTLEAAAVFFGENLKKHGEARGYLKSRGLAESTIREWRIGFAPDEWRLLNDDLRKRGFSEKELFNSGLIKRSEGERESYYDVFRGRITFPIFDNPSRIVGFSGRILKETSDSPKYLNTPETELFNKSEALYGIHKAKMAIRKRDYSILVEGQMDLLMCHQAGFDNAVATSGTSFTRGHLEKLRRLSNRILMSFDSDSAGFKAAERSAKLALSLGMEVKIAELPKGTDPALLIQTKPTEWKEALKNSKHIINFYLDHLLFQLSDRRNLAREIAQKILPYIVMLESSIEQSHFVTEIAKKTGLRDEAIWNDLKSAKPPEIESDYDPERGRAEKEEVSSTHRNHIERRIAGILFWQKETKSPFLSYKDLVGAVEAIVSEDYLKSLLNSLKSEKDELAFEAEVSYEDAEKLKADLDELLLNFEDDLLRREFTEKMVELQAAETAGDDKETKRLLEICQDISIRLANLSKRRVNEEVKG